MILRKQFRSDHAKCRSQNRTKRQHRGENTARCTRRKAEQCGDHPRNKNKNQHSHAEIPCCRDRNQVKTAARSFWRNETKQATQAANRTAHQHPFRDIAAVHTVQQILHPQHPFIKNRAEDTKNNTEDQIKPERIERRIREFTYVN